MPSEQLTESVKRFEVLFCKFHGESAYKGKNPIEKLTRIISEKEVDIPKDVIYLYVKTRLFIRLKFLNQSLNVASKNLKRKFTHHVAKVS